MSYFFVTTAATPRPASRSQNHVMEGQEGADVVTADGVLHVLVKLKQLQSMFLHDPQTKATKTGEETGDTGSLCRDKSGNE